MITFLVYCLTAYGIAWGLGQAHLSYPIRAWLAGVDSVHKKPKSQLLLTLLECPGCMGWWTGVAASALNLAPPEIFSNWWQAGFATAASNLVLYKFTTLGEYAPPEVEQGSGAHGGDAEPPVGS